jgi:phosphoserine phosphatase
MRLAKDNARADLPEAVGPAMRMACCNVKRCSLMVDRFFHAVLVQPSSHGLLDDALIARAASAVNGKITRISAHAARISEITGHRKAIDKRLHEVLTPAPLDILVLPEGFRPKLFLADMDSTMIGQECIDELADYVGMKSQVSHITERAMRGEIAFEPALRERVALLKGLPISLIDEIIKTRITLTPGGRDLVRFLKNQGAYTCLVSGGFTLFTGPVTAQIGFDEHRSNQLVVEDGFLTGEVKEPILGKQAKKDTLIELRAKHGLNPHDVIAIGDGANDLAMLEEAGLGIAYHAKPAVAAAAHARITHGDLSALTISLTQ